MLRKSLVLISTVLLVVLLNVTSASATGYFIDPSISPSSLACGLSQQLACPCIKDLLKQAILKPGDTINLLPGLYKGLDLNVGLTIDVPNLTIKGDSAATVTIDLEGSPTFLTITVPGVVVAQVTVKGGVTADVKTGVVNIQLTAAASVTGLLDAIRINNVDFLNIQGTAVLCADVNALNGAVDVNVNANIFVNVVLSVCTFVNVTVDPVIQVVGRISLRLNSVSFTNCGSPNVDGAVVLATKSSAVVLVAVTIENCQGGSLLNLNAAATLTLNGGLVVKGNVVSAALFDLSKTLDINLLGVSVRLDTNTAPVACINVKCGILNINCMCENCAAVNLDIGSFF